ncbi:peroxiredoxin-like family protein [Roseimaritima sediminicola]|uniref:peroxiredoxin-like family protein n=1 Tax=Roseimaritima sediminicola TaxID=2662066 RepID=UPI0013870087|nr:peroxiredoxin-like family protein [Roseimaritima sediminicola]
MIVRFALGTFCLSLLFAAGAAAAEREGIAPEAAAARPLEAGGRMPDAQVRSPDGKATTLAKIVDGKPTVLVFFRGSWCPACTRHTGELIKVYPELKRRGVQLVALSADSPKSSAANQTERSIPFPIYSDADLEAAKAFGLAFQVDAGTLARYAAKGYDLNQASGRNHNALPIPAVYIVDRSGKIVYAHSDPDYLKRLDTQVILKNLP